MIFFVFNVKKAGAVDLRDGFSESFGGLFPDYLEDFSEKLQKTDFTPLFIHAGAMPAPAFTIRPEYGAAASRSPFPQRQSRRPCGGKARKPPRRTRYFCTFAAFENYATYIYYII